MTAAIVRSRKRKRERVQQDREESSAGETRGEELKKRVFIKHPGRAQYKYLFTSEVRQPCAIHAPRCTQVCEMSLKSRRNQTRNTVESGPHFRHKQSARSPTIGRVDATSSRLGPCAADHLHFPSSHTPALVRGDPSSRPDLQVLSIAPLRSLCFPHSLGHGLDTARLSGYLGL